MSNKGWENTHMHVVNRLWIYYCRSNIDTTIKIICFIFHRTAVGLFPFRRCRVVVFRPLYLYSLGRVLLLSPRTGQHYTKTQHEFSDRVFEPCLFHSLFHRVLCMFCFFTEWFSIVWHQSVHSHPWFQDSLFSDGCGGAGGGATPLRIDDQW